MLTLIEGGEVLVKKIEHLFIQDREEALSEKCAEALKRAKVLFFTGGDQLRITSQLGDSRVYQGIKTLYAQGGTIAGTSAGASVMSETMLISGNGDESHKLDQVLGMAPGLGLIRNMIIDQHFAQRWEPVRPARPLSGDLRDLSGIHVAPLPRLAPELPAPGHTSSHTSERSTA